MRVDTFSMMGTKTAGRYWKQLAGETASDGFLPSNLPMSRYSGLRFLKRVGIILWPNSRASQAERHSGSGFILVVPVTSRGWLVGFIAIRGNCGKDEVRSCIDSRLGALCTQARVIRAESADILR